MRFDMICQANGIEHRLTKPNHPWTNGQVERMNRTIKEATVKRYHYDSHDQLSTHLADFMAAYNFARRLKTLNGLTPYEYICKIWTSEPERFIRDPIHQMPGLNTYILCTEWGIASPMTRFVPVMEARGARIVTIAGIHLSMLTEPEETLEAILATP